MKQSLHNAISISYTTQHISHTQRLHRSVQTSYNNSQPYRQHSVSKIYLSNMEQRKKDEVTDTIEKKPEQSDGEIKTAVRPEETKSRSLERTNKPTRRTPAHEITQSFSG